MKFAPSRHEIVSGFHVGGQQFHVATTQFHDGFCASTTYDMKVPFIMKLQVSVMNQLSAT